MSITILASVASIIKCLIYCFAEEKNVLYSVLGIATLDLLFNEPIRSSMSKIVGTEDIGKVRI